jgi:hypothetical protein
VNAPADARSASSSGVISDSVPFSRAVLTSALLLPVVIVILLLAEAGSF